jgi:hypothetical protein
MRVVGRPEPRGADRYQGSSILAGDPAPLIAAALMGASGETTYVALYLIICVLISIAALACGPETRARIWRRSPENAERKRHGILGRSLRRAF